MEHKKVLLFISSLIGILTLTLWLKLNQPAPPVSEQQKKQMLEQTLGRSIRQEKNIPQGEQRYEGKFFSLDYPAYAQVYDRENANISKNKNFLEYFRLDSEEPKFRFVVIVEKTEVAVLEELSGVRMRAQNKLYQELPITIDNSRGALFIKTSGGVERSTFLLKDGRSYSFVITGVDGGELEDIYGQIMGSALLLK